jgi:hypothetical protein
MLLSSAPLLAQTVQQPQPPAPQAEKAAVPASEAPKVAAPEPDPRQLLQQMCDFLKSQQRFTYKAEVVDDQVYQGGKNFSMALTWRPKCGGLTGSGSTRKEIW